LIRLFSRISASRVLALPMTSKSKTRSTSWRVRSASEGMPVKYERSRF
jgi:hypothetical protein